MADDLSRGFGMTPAPERTPLLATEREQMLHDDLDVQLNALGAITQREGVSWDTWMPIGMQVAVMVLAVQVCGELEKARAADDATLFPMAEGRRRERGVPSSGRPHKRKQRRHSTRHGSSERPQTRHVWRVRR